MVGFFFKRFSIYKCKRTISVFVLFQLLGYEIEVIFLHHLAPLSEKQTHRKLSGSVGLGQFSTQSGQNNLTG
jgi:hypothetical protein